MYHFYLYIYLVSVFMRDGLGLGAREELVMEDFLDELRLGQLV